MPLEVGPTRGRKLRRHGEHHCTGAGRTLSEDESCEPPMVPGTVAVRRKAIRSTKSGLVGRAGVEPPYSGGCSPNRGDDDRVSFASCLTESTGGMSHHPLRSSSPSWVTRQRSRT